jgi:hypothetical protein
MQILCPCCGTKHNQLHRKWCPQPPRMSLPDIDDLEREYNALFDAGKWSEAAKVYGQLLKERLAAAKLEKVA